MRILALDWGSVRFGAAISDPDNKIAFPLEKFIESKDAIVQIKSLVQEKAVEKIIIGLPKNMAGEDTSSTNAVKGFVKELQEQVICPIEFFDERLSSIGAEKTLSADGINQKEQRGLVDNLAAQQMLQQYLDTRPND